MLTLVFGMLTSIAFSQGYHKLIRTNTYWDEYTIILPEICYSYANRVFFTNQDTVINGLTYKISKTQQILQVNPGPFCPPFIIDTVAYTGALLREDTMAKRVYINSVETGGTDELLYDFSLHQGDTLKSNYLGGGDIIIIDTVEDLLLNNGETRKTFLVKSNLYVSYTEGIGSSFGLYAPIPIIFCECNGGYFCVQESSVSLLGYQCDYPYVGHDEIKDSQVSLYPNPANDVINVFIPQALVDAEFILISLQGEQVFLHYLSSMTNSISISDVIPGVYFYQIKSDRLIQTGKLTIL